MKQEQSEKEAYSNLIDVSEWDTTKEEDDARLKMITESLK